VSDYDFLGLDDVMAVHATALARHGGLDGVRDRGLLISAIEQPRSSFGGMSAGRSPGRGGEARRQEEPTGGAALSCSTSGTSP
jgi:hypothetical protein